MIVHCTLANFSLKKSIKKLKKTYTVVNVNPPPFIFNVYPSDELNEKRIYLNEF